MDFSFMPTLILNAI